MVIFQHTANHSAERRMRIADLTLNPACSAGLSDRPWVPSLNKASGPIRAYRPLKINDGQYPRRQNTCVAISFCCSEPCVFSR